MSVVPAKPVLSEEEIERKSKAIIDEFLHINDYKVFFFFLSFHFLLLSIKLGAFCFMTRCTIMLEVAIRRLVACGYDCIRLINSSTPTGCDIQAIN